ncbi:hypothetical protein ACOMICROBIO_FLGHMIGD_04197 [Vibrio sp. B1FLJ16]|uniref:hypothetical protein n=1 Tax=Vibrio sp. B1FLJ16 TaxID=2751178 RepID=UPI001AF6FB6E|nr:hypothetical protein [Vibrio sp. B1FLJ16]CAD7820564.1 hypothetical protein ACOMICROBIO_FLGHMIGD_04197 [Vibrio sp. B1FLJ16]CAE6943456.1 hypothetical protein ACOMICROBIO_FLGHMIGD_04197 [Vibrio sp. B1FLJ16]
MEYPIQLFGYLNEQDAEPTCMVSNVTKDTVQELNKQYGFKVDDWAAVEKSKFTVHTRQPKKLVRKLRINMA